MEEVWMEVRATSLPRTAFLPSGGEGNASMTCSGRSRLAPPYCWEGARSPSLPWWFAPGSNFQSRILVDIMARDYKVFCHSWLLQVVVMYMPMTLVSIVRNVQYIPSQGIRLVFGIMSSFTGWRKLDVHSVGVVLGPAPCTCCWRWCCKRLRYISKLNHLYVLENIRVTVAIVVEDITEKFQFLRRLIGSWMALSLYTGVESTACLFVGYW